ncbi:MAG: ParB N-terminal domain-containing protein [Pseudomonadota bacterium]
MAISKYQKFEPEVIQRSQIKLAAYNPRKMDEAAKKRLKADLKVHGLVETLVWNKRTGNLVGGHQRLEQLDALERNKNYDLAVAVVDVSEEEEKKLNIILNNPGLQGEWDIEALKDMQVNCGIDFHELGFVDSEIDYLFDGDSDFSKQFTDSEEVKFTKEEIANIKKTVKQNANKTTQDTNPDFFFIVVCDSAKEKNDFLREIGVPVSEKYVAFHSILRIRANKDDLVTAK